MPADGPVKEIGCMMPKRKGGTYMTRYVRNHGEVSNDSAILVVCSRR
jgi:hypothetical protein